MSSKQKSSPALTREVGTFGAVMLGLGSILGAGVFVCIALAAGVAGPAVLLAIVLAALLALCNAFSSAQLAASHPQSGGTYEYGYTYLRPELGFTAGWMFLCAKSASAATAALGFSSYLLRSLDGDLRRGLVPVALLACLGLTAVVLGGMRRSSLTNTVIVSITLLALLALVLAGLPHLLRGGLEPFLPFFEVTKGDGQGGLRGWLHATALMFVAYTGYGRVATLGEEVREPRRIIPRAILWTLTLSAGLYLAVGVVAVGTVGAEALGAASTNGATPLDQVARQLGAPGLRGLVAVGAMTAMLGVLLNLLLGLSRVALAMGRRGDLPTAFAKLDARGSTPTVAVAAVGILVAGLCTLGRVEITWAFSAFTVLVYYAITNLAALGMPKEKRLYSPFFAWAGLVGCLFLAFWVEAIIWLSGVGLAALGLLWHRLRQRHLSA